ncbi:MAG: hypothetical protein AAF371_11610 [Pseudomonadota bacterium]
MRLLYLAAVILAPLVVLALQTARFDPYNEGVVITFGMLIADGFWPGKDFHATYGPLHYILGETLYSAFGGNLLAPRLYYISFLALAFLGLTSLLEPWRDRTRLAAALLLLAVLTAVSLKIADVYFWPGRMALGLCALFLMAMLLRPSGDTGPSGAFRVALAHMLLLVPLLFIRPVFCAILLAGLLAAAPLHLANHGALNAGAAARFGSGLLVAIGAVALALISYELATDGALAAAMADLDEIGAGTYRAAAGLPFPPFGWPPGREALFSYAPIWIIGGAGAIYLAALLRDGILAPRQKDGVLYMLMVTGALYSFNIVRTHPTHAFPSLLVSLALAAYLGTVLAERFLPRRILGPLSAVGIVGGLVALPGTGLLIPSTGQPTLAETCTLSNAFEPPYGCLVIEERHKDLHRVLEATLRPGERFHSANARHDKGFGGNLSHYAVTGHLPLSYWAQFDPGVQSTARVQRAIVAELEAAVAQTGRAVVVIEEQPPPWEPNLSSQSSGVTILEDWLDVCAPVFLRDRIALVICGETSRRPDTIDRGAQR